MTRSPAPRRGALLRAAGALAAVIGLGAGMLGLAAGPAGAASMSLGSVPAVVSDYVSSGAMVTRLNDVYGPNASGTQGIDFDDTTKVGPISRVYEWTAQRLANHATDHPVQLTNNWVVPITIGGKSVGLATIWINPQTVDAELAEFTPSAKLGTALTSVPATAALVRDPVTGAWLALDHGTVTALIAGRSGITKPVPVGSLKLSPTAPAPVTSTEPNTGLALAIGVVAVIVIVILVALLMPRRRRRADESPAPATAESGTGASTPAKPGTAKPAGPRPDGRTPTTSAAAKPTASKPTTSRAAVSKPAASKPPTSKPPVSKPPVSKPPVQKQPPRPRTQKPPADPDS